MEWNYSEVRLIIFYARFLTGFFSMLLSVYSFIYKINVFSMPKGYFNQDVTS